MTREETVTLAQYVHALCPQQAIDRYTPIAWHDVLGHLEYEECRQAARAVAARQPFVAPSEIIREIADARSATMRQSQACRDGDCDGCRFSFCSHSCHPSAVGAIAGPPPAPRPSLGSRGGDPRQITSGDLPGRQ